MAVSAWLRCYTLSVNGETVAVQFGVQVDRVYNTFALAWAARSPSQALLKHVIAEAIGEGVQEFDMLRGIDAHKMHWTDRVLYDEHVVVAHGTRGRTWLAADELYETTRAAGRKLLDTITLARLNHLLATIRH